MNISNMKIGTRLSAGFFALLLLTVMLGAFSITRLSEINENTADIATNWLVGTRSLSNYGTSINYIRRVEANAAMATTDEDFKNWEQRVVETKVVASAALKRYMTTVDSDEEHKLLDKILLSEKRYYEAHEEFLNAYKKSGFSDALRAAYTGKSRATMQELTDAVKVTVDFQGQGADSAYKSSQETFAHARTMVIIILIISLIVGTMLAWAITKSITQPVSKALQLAQTVAAGDLTSSVDIHSRDELGQMLEALVKMNGNLSGIVKQVREGADAIANGSSEIASGNLDLSSRTEQQASALEETASSMEEMTSTVKQNADNARQANSLVGAASQIATKGGQVVSQVVDTMGAIETSARKIVEIISVIDGIAFQTNILALNAAVEAARAGEQGRGFAVVATEVRNLAHRSAAAAKEIKILINDSVQKVTDGSALVAEAGSTMDEVVASVRRVADLMGEISSASDEQESGIGQINQAITEMDGVTQQNAALVEEAAGASASLQQQASQLAEVVSIFKINAESHANTAHNTSIHPLPSGRTATRSVGLLAQ